MKTTAKIPQRNKDLVFGYCHEHERKHKLFNPHVINELCLGFFNPNKDNFDKASTHNSDAAIEIQPQLVKANVDAIPDFPSDQMNTIVHLANEVHHGQHEWKFKIKCDANPKQSKGFVGIKRSDDEDGWGYGWVIDTRWNVALTDQLIKKRRDPELSCAFKKDYYKFAVSEKNYEKMRVANGDIVKMKYNGETRDIYFAVNDGEWCHKIKGKYIEKGKYKAILGIKGSTWAFNRNHKCEYELLSYQMTY